MNPIEKVLRRIDRFQQEHRRLAFPVAVIKKFGDDRAGTWAAVLAYDAFLSVFPLLLLLTTLVAYASQHNPDVHQAVLDSALRDFPIIGKQLTENVQPLHGSALAVAVGGLMLLWGSRGLSDAGQLAMAEIWNVPDVRRPGFLPRLVRSVGFVAALGIGIGLTTFVAALAANAPGALASRSLALVGGVAVNVALFVALFRVLTPEVGTRDLIPGAVVAGFGWSILQVLGTFLVSRTLRDASEVYGYFGSVLGLISWLFLTAQLTLYAAEINVVRARKLWPRSIVQPPLTDADRRVFDAIAQKGRRRPEQHVVSGWRRKTA
jgi:YihY family inner membrane protein